MMHVELDKPFRSDLLLYTLTHSSDLRQLTKTERDKWGNSLLTL